MATPAETNERVNDLKMKAQAAIDQRKSDLVDISHKIHGWAELAFEEHKSAHLLADYAMQNGFEVDRGVGGLATAFTARYGSGRSNIAICAEYDALPEIGHACGHNIIAASSLGAAIALASVAGESGVSVNLVGTPAEEVGDGAGKVILLERGVFDEADIAIMVHPAPGDVLEPLMIAAATLDIDFRGTPTHAAFYPELGVNAADALTVAQVAIALIRQHILPTDRIHGFTIKGGDAANIVPAHTVARYMARSVALDDLAPLVEKVRRCFESGAIATGAELAITGGDRPYAEVIHDRRLVDFYARNAKALGREFSPGQGRPSGSTDMGNVSQRVPSIHPLIGIDSLPAVNHQPGFTDAAIGRPADQAVIDGAVALAWTAIDHAATAQFTRERAGD